LRKTDGLDTETVIRKISVQAAQAVRASASSVRTAWATRVSLAWILKEANDRLRVNGGADQRAMLFELFFGIRVMEAPVPF
jgi:hypothetical protein